MSLDPGPLASGFFILNSKFFILHSQLRPVYAAIAGWFARPGPGRRSCARIEGGEYQAYYIGLEELIRNKEAVRRYKDLEDLKYIRAALNRKG